MTYDFGNLGLGLGLAQKCVGVKLVVCHVTFIVLPAYNNFF
jgi:hypothetical protein